MLVYDDDNNNNVMMAQISCFASRLGHQNLLVFLYHEYSLLEGTSSELYIESGSTATHLFICVVALTSTQEENDFSTSPLSSRFSEFVLLGVSGTAWGIFCTDWLVETAGVVTERFATMS